MALSSSECNNQTLTVHIEKRRQTKKGLLINSLKQIDDYYKNYQTNNTDVRDPSYQKRFNTTLVFQNLFINYLLEHFYLINDYADIYIAH